MSTVDEYKTKMAHWWNDTNINIKVLAEKHVKLPLYLSEISQ
jgi:hypothetical protein